MRLIKYEYQRERKTVGEIPSSALALGLFDGVHLGHRELIRKTAEEAKQRGLALGIFTFSAEILPKSPDMKRIYTTEEKLRLFEDLGVELVILADFGSICALSASEFVEGVLIRDLGCKFAATGYNFRFGKGASGDADRLSALMQEKGRSCAVIPPAYLGDRVISSSAIRAAVEAGDTDLASAMLGRPFSLTAPVLRGRGFGHTEGVPTLNQVFCTSGIVPKSGVYAPRVLLGDRRVVRGKRRHLPDLFRRGGGSQMRDAPDRLQRGSVWENTDGRVLPLSPPREEIRLGRGALRADQARR